MYPAIVGKGHTSSSRGKTRGYCATSQCGVSKQAIEDALTVCALFNMIDRMADALNVAVPSAKEFALTGERLLEHGYL